MRNAIFMIVLLAAFATTAPAAPLTWTLQGVTFDDGATASGSFVHDAATGQYSDIVIDVTPPFEPWWESRYAFACTSCALQPPSATAVVLLAETPASGLDGAQALELTFGTALTDSGGTVVLGSGMESLCADSTCTAFGEFSRNVSTGSVTAPVPPAASAAVPVPSLSPTMSLILAAMLMLAVFRASPRLQRRRR